jgi:anthranilate phosphoribosyltransferase
MVTFGLQVGIPILVASMAFASSTLKYPSADPVWGSRQYTDFYFVHFNTHLALPHLRNPESRTLFERIVSHDNIGRILTASLTRHEKQRELAMILSAMGGIRASYNLAVIIGEPLQEELTRVQVFHLYLIGAVADLADEDISEKNCASAMKTAWLGVVQSLSEANVYSPTQIARLSDAAARRYPILSPLFPANERAGLRKQIAALRGQQPEPEAHRALARLLATVSDE